MAERPSIDVEWVLDRDASSDEVAEVAQIALEAGLPGQVTAALSQKSLGDQPWMILLLVPITPFLKGFLEEAGRSSYKALHELVSRLVAARRKGPGHVELRDEDPLTVIVFAPDSPEEAFKQLVNLGLDNIQGKYWVWDSEQQCWICQPLGDE